ncbi:MAG: glycoside hydrolase family 32 protein [Solirubrobacterales bacterium]
MRFRLSMATFGGLALAAGLVGSATAASQEPLERYRPSYHFTPQRNWMNDPNGLVHYRGTYHLFFQHNPYGTLWGNMSWGHATSKDLVNWSEKPVAIPQTLNQSGKPVEDIFSGSVVIDRDNTSGFGTRRSPPLVAIYTSSYTPSHPEFPGLQAQSLAYSTDRGRTWEKYEGNPVLDRNSASFRDPKVFAYDGPAGSYWVMAAVEATERKVVLYKSRNLTDWKYLSEFGPANAVGGLWECPDLFPVRVEGTDRWKWVMIVNVNPGGVAGGSGGQYFVGQFDGRTFTPDTAVTGSERIAEEGATTSFRHGWLDRGRDYYATVTFSGLPRGKAITIGWMSNWDYALSVPTSTWRGSMSLPRELRLIKARRGPRLVQRPVDQLASLERPATLKVRRPLPIAGRRSLAVRGGAVRVDATLAAGRADRFGLSVLGNRDAETAIGYDTATGKLFVDRTRSGDVDFNPKFASVEAAPVRLVDGELKLTVFLDRASVEVFARGGRKTITDQVFPPEGADRLGAWAEGGSAVLEKLTVTPMRPMSSRR